MFLRSSAMVYPHLYLLTLGETCRYLVAETSDSLTLSDPGLSCHAALLPQRFNKLGFDISHTTNIIMTNLDADRVAGIPVLRAFAPKAKLLGTPLMQRQLSDPETIKRLYEFDRELTSKLRINVAVPQLTLEQYRAAFTIDKRVHDSDVIEIGPEISLRVVSTPGHREHSVSYLLLPHEFIIADQTFGYFNGNRLAAPGGDFGLDAACRSIKKFGDLDLSGLGLPYGGALTGDLVKKHIQNVVQNTTDLITAVQEARTAGVSEDEIRSHIREGFFSSGSRDPFLQAALVATEQAVVRQIS